MFCGLLWEGDIAYTIDADASASGDISGFGYSLGGQLTTYFASSYLTQELGARLMVVRSKGPLDTDTPEIYYEMEVPYLALGASGSLPDGDITGRLEFRVQVICEGSGFLTANITNVDLYVSGSLIDSYTPVVPYQTADVTTSPMSLRVLAVDPLAEAKFFVGPVPVPGLSYVDEFNTSGSVSATIGKEFRELGEVSWSTLPFHISGYESDIVSPTGATCNGVTVSASASYHGGASSYTNEESCTVYLFPNANREVRRLNSDYRSIWFRRGLPSSEKLVTTQVGYPFVIPPPPDPPPYVVTNTYSNLYDAQTIMLAAVTTDPSYIEDPLSIDLIPPFTQTKLHSEWTSGIETIYTDNKFVTFPVSATPGDTAEYLVHASPVLTIWNTWFNPHWSYALWFPSDDAPTEERWSVLGAPAGIDEFWFPTKRQFISNPELPEEDNTRHMVNVITEPLAMNGNRDLVSSTIGVPSYLGITRFERYKESTELQLTTDETSADRFDFLDGTGSVDMTGIILNTSTKVRFPMIDWTIYPIAFPAVCNRVTLEWDTANVTSVKVYYEGLDTPTRVLITDNVQGTFDLPVGDSTKWGTDAAFDHGGSILTDTYNPSQPDDISPTIIASAKDTATFSLLKGYSGPSLVIEVTKIDTGESALIEHLTFHAAPAESQKSFHTMSRHVRILSEEGPGIGYGMGGFFDYLGDSLSDELIPETTISFDMAAGDAIAWNNAFRKGKIATDSLATIIANYFVEDLEWTLTKHLWRDPYAQQLVAHSFVIDGANGPQWYMVNSRRELPPLAAFPLRSRDIDDDYDETGDYGIITYSFVQSNQPHIVPGNVAPKVMYGGADMLSPITCPTGWKASGFNHPVDTSTAYDWTFQHSAINWYTFTAWARGTFNILGQMAQASYIAACRDIQDVHYIAYTEGDQIKLTRWDIFGNTYLGVITTLSGECQGLGITWGINGNLTCKYSVGDTVYTIDNYAQGEDTYWSEEVAIGSGTELAVASCWINDVEYTAILDGTTWKLYTKLDRTATDTYLADIVSGVSSTSRGGLTSSQNGFNMISFVYQDGGTVYRLASVNYGETWETV